MKSPPENHPKPAELRAFGLGKLDPAASDTVNQHLETCVDCRQVVAESSGDSFLSRLRAAQAKQSCPARREPFLNPTLQRIPPLD